MMYYPTYPALYGAQLPQAAQIPPQAAQQPAPSTSGIIFVQGEAAAKSYIVAPNTSVWLMDVENNTFYIKQADISGIPLPLRIFDFSERTPENAPKSAAFAPQGDYITREEFNALEAKINAFTAVRKPDITAEKGEML